MSDANPPAWRGAAGSTFQHWGFSTPPIVRPPVPAPWDPNLMLPGDSQKIAPEKVVNPYGKPDIIVEFVDPPFTEWRPTFARYNGVWRLEPHDVGNAHLNGSMIGWIPNCRHDAALWKIIRVQITYDRVTDDPIVSISAGQQPVVEIASVSQKVKFGWTHTTWDFYTPCQVAGEQLDIMAQDTIYIDQVVVDTFCPCQKGQEDPEGQLSEPVPVRARRRPATPKAARGRPR